MSPAEDAVDGWQLLDQSQLEDLAARYGRVAPPGLVVHLQGELGAGKSTFARAYIRARLPGARVKSPTYTLVEPYHLADGGLLHHLDLYRTGDPSELEALGVRELVHSDSQLLIEWPERAQGALPGPDLRIELKHAGSSRAIRVTAETARGTQLLENI